MLALILPLTRLGVASLGCGSCLPHAVAPGVADPAAAGIDVDPARLAADVDTLARSPRRSEARRAEVRAWLRSELEAVGFPVEDRLFDIAGVQGVNVVGRGAGGRVLVGAHYDTVGDSPGADDNASGVAAALAVARALGPARAVDYAFFDAEEPHDAAVGTDGRNFAFGSEAFVAAGARYELVVVLESVGYRCDRPGCQHVPAALEGLAEPDGGAVYLVGNPSERWADALATFQVGARGTPATLIVVPGAGKVAPQSRFSDHAPFWDVGVDALLVTDTALLRNPTYHRATDTAVDVEFLADVARGAAALADSAAR